MNPFTFLTGLVANIFSKPTAAGSPPQTITLNATQITALIQAAEVFGPALMGVSPTQVTVAENLLKAFGFGGLIPPLPKA
jgi:hypothetical protein